MLVMRTTEGSANSVGEVVSSQKSVGFDDLALAVYPFRLDGIQPRTLLRQEAAYDPHPFAAVLNAAVVLPEPPSLTSLEVCQLALSQMRSSTLFPAAWSFSKLH